MVKSLFLFLFFFTFSTFAQDDRQKPLYGKMEIILCGDDIGIDGLEDSCLLLFESVDGSPKYGAIFDTASFYYDLKNINGHWGYIDRDYFDLLKSGRLLYELQERDDSYFYVVARDNGLNSLLILDSLTP